MPAELADWVRDARRRTIELIDDLHRERLLGPRIPIVNPRLWEIGHLGWFQEKWVLRHAAGQPPLREGVDALYDSDAVAHPTRWDLPLIPRADVLRWMEEIQARVLERLEGWAEDAPELYFVRLAVLHEDMHGEALCYTRQTLGDPPAGGLPDLTDALGGDLSYPGGTFDMGGRSDETFVFDNEQWTHPVTVAPFRMARGPVTEGQFADFVDDGGYARRELWSGEGWRWRARVSHPLYWRREGAEWITRVFNQERSLRPQVAMLHVNWHEAEAWCRWAGRRLPAEAEWEFAARHGLDRGAVWEWTADRFEPYPGFSPGPYATYSAPYFGTHRVLRGGCWATRERIARPTYRNFYMPDRRDVFAGFRTCA